jgi:carbonic anhydrase
MDARIDPAAALGISLGDAHVIRNAGGNARDALRSIIISEQLLGTKEIVLIKHTDCGMVTFQNSDAHSIVEKNLGPSAAAEIGTLDFQPFPDAEQAAKDDVEYLRKSATVPQDVVISGWIYDVHSGKVTKLI